MIWLNVHITLPDALKLKCGEIVTKDPNQNGFIQGSFRYVNNFLEHPKAFALDPVTLTLSNQEFLANRPEGIHAVFEDALPDDWGRKLLIRRYRLSRTDQTPARLLAVLGANGLGALSFEQKNQESLHKPLPTTTDLEAILNAALKFDAGRPMEKDQLNILFAHGSSPGGARPKAMVNDNFDTPWLAKFPKHDDSFSIESIETACLKLAADCGLNVPRLKLIDVGDRKVLMLERFDVSKNNGRYHMISMQTLLKAQGYYQLGYNHMFEILRKFSCQPSIDMPSLFKQMVFNAAIGNTDDHLKNFCMLHKENGFCLSPAYDLLPDIYGKREHTLRFSDLDTHFAPDRKAFMNIARQTGIPKAGLIIDQVVNAISDWKKIFHKFDVPKPDIDRLKSDIARRLKKLV